MPQLAAVQRQQLDSNKSEPFSQAGFLMRSLLRSLTPTSLRMMVWMDLTRFLTFTILALLLDIHLSTTENLLHRVDHFLRA